VRNPPSPRTGYFLGVRLTEEELRRLDDVGRARGTTSRSQTVRELLREAMEHRVAPGPSLPATLQNALEEVVEAGFAANEESALTLLATLGLPQLRLQAEHVSALRGAARELADRRKARRRAARTGRELLER
jgi:hypothetical protein